jgi:hypothetical protein
VAIGSDVLDANLIAPNLYIGSFPQPGDYPWVAAIALCAQELQPPSASYPGKAVIRVRLDDDPRRPMRPSEIELARAGARIVVQFLRRQEPVLVTCAMGLNRSALVAGLAMRMTYGIEPSATIETIRAVRGPRAFSNPNFVRFVKYDQLIEPARA